jgi:hypothetical protein
MTVFTRSFVFGAADFSTLAESPTAAALLALAGCTFLLRSAFD